MQTKVFVTVHSTLPLHTSLCNVPSIKVQKIYLNKTINFDIFQWQKTILTPGQLAGTRKVGQGQADLWR